MEEKSSLITLKPIDQQNYLAAFALRLGPGQDRYVSHPVRSLAQAYVYRDQCTPFGIYDQDTMVGYLMVIYDDEEQTYNLWHMMIDQSRQRRGYGRAAIQEALNYMRQRPFGPSDRVLITCSPDNAPAYRLYQQLGFALTGRSDEDEVELFLPL